MYIKALIQSEQDFSIIFGTIKTLNVYTMVKSSIKNETEIIILQSVETVLQLRLLS